MNKQHVFLTFMLMLSLINIACEAQDSPLLTAIKQSDLATVKQLVNQGAEVNQTDENGAPLLMWAAYKSNVEMLRYLIEQGANPEQKGVIWYQQPDASFGNLTGLAAFNGDLPMLKYLIEEVGISPFDRGFHPVTQAATGWTAYEFAAMQQKREILTYLSTFENPLIVLTRNHDIATEDNGQIPPLVGYLLLNPNSIQTTDKAGRTALHLAASTGNLEVLKILLKKGATITAIDKQGQTALHVACENGQYETAKFLIEQGSGKNIQDKLGNTPLILAAKNDHLKIVKMLYYLKADTNLKNTQNKTAMDVSQGQSKAFFKQPQPDYFQLLDIGMVNKVVEDIKNGICSIQITDEEGNTLLHKAATYGYTDLAQLLIDKDLNINQARGNGSTPLMIAAHKNQVGVAKLLIEKGANIHLKRPNSWTVFHLAVEWADIKIVQLLIEKGANVNGAIHPENLSPLMIASFKNRPEIAALLLKNGSKINEVNQIGGSALHATVEGYGNWVSSTLSKGRTPTEWVEAQQKVIERHYKTVELLLDNGINVSFKIETGETALDLSKAYGVDKVTQLLEQYPSKKKDKMIPQFSTPNDNTGYGMNRIILPTGHTDAIQTIDISPDGRYVLSGSMDKYFIIWDLRTGMEVFKKELNQTVSAVTFSPNAKTFALAFGDIKDNIQLWDFETTVPAYKKTFTGQANFISTLLFSTDGKQLISTSYDGTYQIIDVETGKSLQEIKAHQDWLVQATLSQDGQWLATVSKDKTVKVWEIATSQLKQRLEGHTSMVMGVSFLPDNIHLASTDSSGHLIEWNWRTGTKTFEHEQAGNINTVAYSHQGKYLAFDSVLLNANTKKKIRDTRQQGNQLNINALRFSKKDDILLGSGSFFDASIKVWSVETGQLLQELKGHTEMAAIIPLSDKQILTATLFARIPQRRVRRWNIAQGAMELLEETAGDISLTALNVSKNKKYIAIGKNSIKINEKGQSENRFFISIESLNQLDTTKLILEGHTGEVKTLAFSPDGRYLISSADVIRPSLEAIENIDLNNLQSIYNTNFDSDIRLWDLNTGQQIKTFKGHTAAINSLEFSPDGQYILSAALDGKTRIWEVSTNKELKSIEAGSPAVFINKGQQVVTKGRFNPLVIWNISTHTRTALGFSTASFPVALHWSTQQKQLMVGMNSGELLLWDMKNEQIKQKFEGHSNRIFSIHHLPDHNHWISSSADGTIKLWHEKDPLPIATYVSIDKNDYLTITPDKYYTGSKNASRKMKFAIGKETYTFDQFDPYFNRPDLVMKRIGLASESDVQWYGQAHQRRMTLSGFQAFDPSILHTAPQLDILNDSNIPFESTERTINFHIKANGHAVPLQKMVATINDAPVKTIDLTPLNTTVFEQKISLQLSKGFNQIQLFCQNGQGIESLHRTFTVFYEGDGTKPTLHLLLLGVSEHQNKMAKLDYAAQDAADIKKLFLQKKADYKDIRVKMFTNQEVTLDNIRSAKKWLQKTHIDDKVIVFYAGHGVRNMQQELYFSTYDMDFSEPAKAGLAYRELEELLTDISARQKLLLLDACQAGEVSKSIPSKAFTPSSPAKEWGFTRGLGRKLKHSISPNDFDLMKMLFVDLRNRTGTIVMAGASGTQVALEGSQWNNGAFTYCLKEKLQGNQEAVTVSELQEYLERRVLEATKGVQRPVMRLENISNDWRIW